MYYTTNDECFHRVMHFEDLQTVNRCLFFLFSCLGCDKLFAGWILHIVIMVCEENNRLLATSGDYE